MEEEYEIKWWKEWLEADSIDRMKMVEKLTIINEVVNFSQFPEEFRKHSFALTLNGFFEDLESAVYTKIRLEEKDQKENSH